MILLATLLAAVSSTSVKSTVRAAAEGVAELFSSDALNQFLYDGYGRVRIKTEDKIRTVAAV